MFDLKKFREANGITQVELAKYLGAKQGFISQMESSDRPIPQKYIDKIKLFNILQQGALYVNKLFNTHC